MFYVYAHYTPQGHLFYIGKGSKKRAYSFYKRSNHWNNIVSKYGNPTVAILVEVETEKEAFKHEIKLIAKYRNEGIKLCNKTDGGEGTSGYKHTDIQRENNRQARLGKPTWNKGVPCREETKLKIREIKLGKVGKLHTLETKIAISVANTGKKRTEEFKNIMRKLKSGLTHSKETKIKIGLKSKGNNFAAGNTNNRAWAWIGTNIKSGEVVKFTGEKEMKAAGLQHTNIIKCINGKRKSHKGYTWHREAWSKK